MEEESDIVEIVISKVTDYCKYALDFIPRQKTLHTLFTPLIQWEKWKRSSWKFKSKLIVFYIIFFGGLAYLATLAWWSTRKQERFKRILKSTTDQDSSLLSVANTEFVDVCIVGAGPSGATCAYYLAKAGKRVLLLDKAEFPRDKCCSGAVTPGAQAHLKQMGVLASILEVSEPKGYWSNTGGIVSPSGYSFVGTYVDYTPGRAIAVQRSILDHKIAQAAAAEGAVVVDGCAVTSARFSKTSKMWTVNCIQDAQERVKFHSRVLVAADGAKSKLAKNLGVVTTDPESLGSLIMCNCTTGRPKLRADLVVFYSRILMAYHGYFAIFRHIHSMFALSCIMKKNASEQALASLNTELITNDPLISKCLGTNIVFSSMKHAPCRTVLVPKPYADHFLVIGDAAGQCNPLTGVGIQYGMDAAKIAAQTLVEGFTIGNLNATFLRKYHQRIKSKFGTTFLLSRILTKLLYTFPGLFDAGCEAIRKNGAEYLKSWAMIMTGEKSAVWFFRPDVVFEVLSQVLIDAVVKVVAKLRHR